MNASHPLSLDELQTLIRQGIDKAHPLPYWVTAEISAYPVRDLNSLRSVQKRSLMFPIMCVHVFSAQK